MRAKATESDNRQLVICLCIHAENGRHLAKIRNCGLNLTQTTQIHAGKGKKESASITQSSGILHSVCVSGSPRTSLAAQTGDPSWIPGLRRSSGEGNGNPLQYSCLEKFHGQRSLAGYSPQSCKELNVTEQLSTYTLFIAACYKWKTQQHLTQAILLSRSCLCHSHNL